MFDETEETCKYIGNRNEGVWNSVVPLVSHLLTKSCVPRRSVTVQAPARRTDISRSCDFTAMICWAFPFWKMHAGYVGNIDVTQLLCCCQPFRQHHAPCESTPLAGDARMTFCAWLKKPWDITDEDEIVGFLYLGHSNWTICSLLSHFCFGKFSTFALSYWEANTYYPRGPIMGKGEFSQLQKRVRHWVSFAWGIQIGPFAACWVTFAS